MRRQTDPTRTRRHRVALEAVRAMLDCPEAIAPGALEWWAHEASQTAPAERSILGVPLTGREARPGR